uniref:Uncharacterized protein n=1 Tax=Chromera velia CCMP2878 TaxID=1169474 RepID=A0A0G4G9R3_9ALVE|eukprot:Cvel_20906.t1-p1 / transcript=Cvel_20906.t1 / gene=Cvel_20906 / organism=Chromera_velia_CCMP2878 / gene_product=Uncharacterized oxidoreductase C736.13, putative / transcript_product=Uncharacterized oxidoreductase C736.13, putative / location=Cvel_scaffold1918:13488-14552(+) / protein_length=355 / sequence_SO=supercontig / SO=protein_coding / is_pseudo=false
MGCAESKPAGGASEPLPVEAKYWKEWLANPENMRDLSGKQVLITGVSTAASLGFFVTEALALKGARCTITCRNRDKGQTVKEALETKLKESGVWTEIEVMSMDNCKFSSVRDFCTAFKEKHDRLDIVVNNAGVMALPYELTEDGYDVQIQTNHLSHFLMTALLWPLIKKTAEESPVYITQVSSALSEIGSPTIPTNDLNTKHPSHGFPLYLFFMIGGGSNDMWARYGSSKLANAVFSQELHRRIEKAGLAQSIVSTASHPGFASTNLQVSSQKAGGVRNARGQQKQAQAAEDGALPLIMAVAGPDSKGGEWFGPKDHMKGPPIKTQNKNPQTYKEEIGAALWDLSEKAVGLKFEV